MTELQIWDYIKNNFPVLWIGITLLYKLIKIELRIKNLEERISKHLEQNELKQNPP